MSDFEFFNAEVSRTSLGDNPLSLSDGVNFKLGQDILGGQLSWNRQTAKSPYVDGEFTVNRTKGRVEERFTVQVLGATQTVLNQNLADLIEAFSQDRFILTIEMDEVPYSYDCEASDYQIDYTGTRWLAKTVLVTFMVPRQPRLLAGGF